LYRDKVLDLGGGGIVVREKYPARSQENGMKRLEISASGWLYVQRHVFLLPLPKQTKKKHLQLVKFSGGLGQITGQQGDVL
jgi:hypothetical protein